MSNGETILGEEITVTSGTTEPAPTTDQSSQGDTTPNTDYLAELVGEGKKYKDITELAKAYKNADTFIETLKAEAEAKDQTLATLEQRLEKSKTVDDVLAALQSKQAPTNQSPNPLGSDHATGGDDAGDSTDPRKLVEQLLEEKEREKAEQAKVQKIKQNQEKAWEMLSSEGVFGNRDEAKRAIARYIQENPDRKEAVSALGSYDPEALVRLLKPEAKISNSSVTGPSTYNPKVGENTGGLTWSQAKEVRKSDPKLYRSIGFQQRIHRAAEADPEFFNK